MDRHPNQRSTYGLRLFHEVLGLDYGHPGIWHGEPLTFANLKRTQQRYADELIGWIDEGVRDVLEVGGGFGGLAAEMARRGLSVYGLTPDPYECESFTARTGLPCYLAQFQDFEPERRFGFVVMNQSCHNMPSVEVFEAARKSAPGGCLLIADYFLRDTANVPAKHRGFEIDAFLDVATASGFDLIRERDLTDAILPTRELRQQLVDAHVLPAIEFVRDAGLRERPLLTRALLWLVGSEVEKLQAKLRVPDPDHYATHRRFKFYLFRVPPPRDEPTS
ncbi:MAG: class I SAM-dependent methyltransferase [Alphaproteobacteria bacterium]|nr:class I SAM-dependent methyltransferase [Alphaproteobacteria bacterium]